MSFSSRDPRRQLALLLVPAVLGVAACGGDAEAEPDTQVAVPTQTAAPEASATLAPDEFPKVAGYLVYVDNERIRLLTEDGRERSFFIAPEEFEQVGVPHLASHAGLTELGFLVTYEQRGKRNYLLGAHEIAPPFAFPDTGSGDR